MKRHACYSSISLISLLLFGSNQVMSQCVFPDMSTPSDQSICNGNLTSQIIFFALTPGLTYNWVNDLPGIGLAQAGTGNIAPFNTINLGNTPKTATIKVTPSRTTNGTGLAYIANFGSANVSVINPATMQNLATIPVGTNPYGVAIAPAANRVFVANRGSGTISVINTVNNSIEKTIAVGSLPQSIATKPDGNIVYVSTESKDSLAIVDVNNGSIIALLPTGRLPNGVAIHPNGSRVYVTNLGDNSITVINATNNTVLTTVAVGSAPQSLCIHPSGSKLYVANGGSNDITVISTLTNAVEANIAVQQNPKGVAIHPTGNRLYVSNYLAGSVSVINLETNNVLQHVTVGTNPHGIAVSTKGDKVMVVNRGSGTVTIINCEDNQVLGNITVGNLPVSPGNFIDHADNCLGVPKTFKITVLPTNNNGPTVQISTSSTQLNPGQTAIINAAVAGAGVQPLIQFYINGALKQSGTQTQFQTKKINHGDKISCRVESNAPCQAKVIALSDTITFSTQVPADYVFFPTEIIGNYSNPANWLNGNYPGETIPTDKTVTFRKNGFFSKATIDINVQMRGNCYVEDSMNFELPVSKIFTVGQFVEIPYFPGFNTSHTSNTVINGIVIGYGIAANFGGLVAINGLVSASPPDIGNDMLQSFLNFDSTVTINGWIRGQVTEIHAKEILITKNGKLTLINGQDFNRNFLAVERIINQGNMDLVESFLTTILFINEGMANTAFLHSSGLLQNSGTLIVDCTHPFGGEAVMQSGVLSNTGTMSFSSNDILRCTFYGDIINDGSISFYSGTTSINTETAVFRKGVINRNTLDAQNGTYKFTGEAINAGNFNVTGRVVVEGSSFTNAGPCIWFVNSLTEANELKGNFLNTGTINNTGKINVSTKFLNAGTLEIIPH